LCVFIVKTTRNNYCFFLSL